MEILNKPDLLTMLLIGLIIGFISGTFGTRFFWLETYKIYTDAIHSQYSWLLRKFGITQDEKGNWEMKNAEGRWIKKDF